MEGVLCNAFSSYNKGYHTLIFLHRCIAPDQRGYGDSDKPDGIPQYHISVLRDDIKYIIKGSKSTLTSSKIISMKVQ